VSWLGRAVAGLLLPLVSSLPACTQGEVEGGGAPTVPAAAHVPGGWYEVVSWLPGPEVSDPAMRLKLEQSGHPWKVRDRATGIELVLVMPGEFLMGSPESEADRNADEGPQHRVRLTQAFYLGATEVTQAQWAHTMGSVEAFFRDDAKPVEPSWVGAQAFLQQANAASPAGTMPLRLPTEAEWEYACRAGTTGPFGFEGPAGHEVLNFNDGVVRSPYVDGELKVVDGRLEVEWDTPPSPGCRMTTAAAGSLPPNAWGLHEMPGNLYEWCADRYAPDAYAGRGPVTVDPFVPATGRDERVLRGGSWYDSAHECRSAVRDGASFSGEGHFGSNRIGFRVARALSLGGGSPATEAARRLRFGYGESPDLPTNGGVRSILEDSRGQYWFGSWMEGVARFDGEGLTYFTDQDGLGNNQIFAIHEDPAGLIWFKTNRGFTSYDGERLVNHVMEDEASAGDWELGATDLWFGGSLGAYRYDGEEFVFSAFPLPDHRKGDWHYGVTGSARGKGGRLWFATWGAVIGYDGRSFTHLEEQDLGLDEDLGRLHVRCVFEDSRGRVWIGNNGIGVLLLEGGAVTNFTQSHGLGRRDHRGNGSMTPQPGDAPEGAPSLHRVFSIGEDRDGHIWFGTVEQGAWRYDGESLRQFTEADGLASEGVMVIFKDSQGELLLGGNGVFQLSGETFRRIH
jgi:formylglycine-generating enzyme required for sulfatase activity